MSSNNRALRAVYRKAPGFLVWHNHVDMETGEASLKVVDRIPAERMLEGSEPGGAVGAPTHPHAGIETLTYFPAREGQSVPENELALFDGEASRLIVRAEGDTADFLLLRGAASSEQLVRYRPFVANSEQAMQGVIRDYQQGRFGEIART